MSGGQSGGGQQQGGQGGQQGGQPQGGQPQGGQPQGGQPQGGQPQGGQRQGGQPPGGQPPGGQPPRGQGMGGSSEIADAAKFGLIPYLLVGLGTYIVHAFGFILGDKESGVFGGLTSNSIYDFSLTTENGVFLATQYGMNNLQLMAVPLAMYVAWYLYQSNEFMEDTMKTGAAASAAGFAASGLLLLLLAILFSPSGAEIKIGKIFPGFLGWIFGVAAVGAGTGFVLDEDPLDVIR